MNQISYSHGPQNKHLLAMTIGQSFDASASRHARREALVVRHQNLRYSWGDRGLRVRPAHPGPAV